jgi:hypothetical protein
MIVEGNCWCRLYIRKKRGSIVHIVFMGVLPPSLTAVASTVSFPCVCILLATPPSKALLYLLSALAHGCQHTETGYCSVIAVKDSLPPQYILKGRKREEAFSRFIICRSLMIKIGNGLIRLVEFLMQIDLYTFI